MFSIVVAPMLMFGCATIRGGLDVIPMFKYGVLINPLVYVAEGMRGALTPQMPHMPLLASCSAMLLLAIVFTLLGVRSFTRRATG